jgi:hypothetical protein
MRVCLCARGTATSNHDNHGLVTTRLFVVVSIGTNLFGDYVDLFDERANIFERAQRVERKLRLYTVEHLNLCQERIESSAEHVLSSGPFRCDAQRASSIGFLCHDPIHYWLRELGLILGTIRYIILMLIIYIYHRFSPLHGSDPRTQPLNLRENITHTKYY